MPRGRKARDSEVLALRESCRRARCLNERADNILVEAPGRAGGLRHGAHHATTEGLDRLPFQEWAPKRLVQT
jgi:hypothetical protein